MLWNYNAIKLTIGWARHPKYRLFLAPMCIHRYGNFIILLLSSDQNPRIEYVALLPKP